MKNTSDSFFSCRRPHTRWTGDWSSDVCSSDLGTIGHPEPSAPPHWMAPFLTLGILIALVFAIVGWRAARGSASAQIGRASCRERVLSHGANVDIRITKKKYQHILVGFGTLIVQ